MAPVIVKADSFDIEKLVLSAPVKATGPISSKIYVSYDNRPGARLWLQTPYFPKAILKTWGTVTQETKTCAFPLDLDNPEIAEFVNKVLVPINEKVIQTATLNSQEWFGRRMTSTEIANNYKSCSKPSTEPGRYSDLLALRIAMKDGLPAQISCFDEEEKEVDFGLFASAAQNGGQFRCLVELGSAWVAQNKTFGVTMYLRVVQYTKKAEEDEEMGFPFM